MEEKSCVTRVHRKFGRFSFHVMDASMLPKDIGIAVESPDFELCGYTWQLRLFLGGSLPQHNGYVSLYLASKSYQDAHASYCLRIASQKENEVDEIYASNGWRTFKAKGDQVRIYTLPNEINLIYGAHRPNCRSMDGAEINLWLSTLY